METKICTWCKIEKPVSSFYPIKKTGNYNGKCKACYITAVVEYQRRNWEKHKTYKRKLYRENREKEIARKVPTNPAHMAIYCARKAGKLTNPNICEECGGKIRVKAHHHNGYDPEHHLDVRWLCSKCHGRAHSKYAEEQELSTFT